MQPANIQSQHKQPMMHPGEMPVQMYQQQRPPIQPPLFHQSQNMQYQQNYNPQYRQQTPTLQQQPNPQVRHYFLQQNFKPNNQRLTFEVSSELTNRIANTLNVAPVYNPGLMYQKQQPQVPPVSSMISPPMENSLRIPPWQQNRPTFMLPEINDANTNSLASLNCLAMSSYLDDDRSAETPAPIPIECHLGPDTPSPSLPSTSPPAEENSHEVANNAAIFDTSELLRLSFSDGVNMDKRHFYTYTQDKTQKRARRTKAEMAADRLIELKKKLMPIEIKEKSLDCSVGDKIRVFTGTGKQCEYRKNLPRVPRMKLTPWNFTKVASMGFMHTQKGIALTCMTFCHFKCYEPQKFMDHLAQHDGMAKTTEPCGICKQNVGDSEFKHMLQHILEQLKSEPKMPVFEILYSKIAPLKDEDETEAELENADDSDATVDYTYEEPTPTPQLELSLRNVELDEETLNEFSNTIGDVIGELSVATPLVETEVEDVLDKHDSDFDPSTEFESEDEIIPDEAVTSDDGSSSDSKSDSESEDESDDNEESEISRPCSPHKLRSSLRDNIENKNPKRTRSDDRSKSSIKIRIRLTRSKSKDAQLSVETIDDSRKDVSRRNSSEKFSSKENIQKQVAENKKKRKRIVSPRESSESERESPKKSKSSKSSKSSKKDEVVAVKAPEEEKPAEDAKLSEVSSVSDASGDAQKSDQFDFLKKIPLGIVMKIKQSTMEPQTLPQKPPLLFSPEAEEISVEPSTSKKFVIHEDVILNAVTPETKRILQTARKSTGTKIRPRSPPEALKKMLPTARKSTGGVFQSTRKSYEKRKILPKSTTEPSESGDQMDDQVPNKTEPVAVPEIKKCFVNLTKFSVTEPSAKFSSKEPDAIIPAALVVQDDDPFFLMMQDDKDEDPVVKMMNDYIISSQNSVNLSQDLATTEIDYEESSQVLDIQPPIPIKDFPAVIEETMNETEAEQVESEPVKNSAKDDGTDDEYFDSLEMPQTPLTPEVEETEHEAISQTLEVTAAPEATEVSQAPATPEDSETETADDVVLVKKPCEKKDKPEEETPVIHPAAPSDQEIALVSSDDDMVITEVTEDATSSILNKKVPKEKRQDMSEMYPWIDDDIVQKWYKKKSRMKCLLSEESLFSTYKCMSMNCSFFTTDLKLFAKHLKIHENVDEFFLCSFCLADEKEPKELKKHLKEYHGFDRYQCSKCMYRACEKFYVDEHRKKFHPDENADGKMTAIYKSASQTVTTKDRMKFKERLLTVLKDKMKPFICPVKSGVKFCGKKFYIHDDFSSHMQKESESTNDSLTKTAICNEISRVQAIMQSDVCELGTYKCLHHFNDGAAEEDDCKDGFHDLDLMREHLAEVHPHNFAFVGERRKEVLINADDSSLNEFKYSHVADLVNKKDDKAIKVKLWHGDVSALTCEEGSKVLRAKDEAGPAKKGKYVLTRSRSGDATRNTTRVPIISDVCSISNSEK